jgi:hypothetical protein
MMEPTKDNLAAMLEAWGRLFGGPWFHGVFPHSNPRFYKYYWWVFHKGSPEEGEAFLVPRYRLCMHDAYALERELRARRETFITHNRQHPRFDPRRPFDPNAKKWANVEWAPCFEDDTDPLYKGFR